METFGAMVWTCGMSNTVPYQDGSINTCDHLLPNGQQAWRQLGKKEEIANPREHFSSPMLQEANDLKACIFRFQCAKCSEVKQVLEIVIRHEHVLHKTPEPQRPTREQADNEYYERQHKRKVA